MPAARPGVRGAQPDAAPRSVCGGIFKAAAEDGARCLLWGDPREPAGDPAGGWVLPLLPTVTAGGPG